MSASGIYKQLVKSGYSGVVYSEQCSHCMDQMNEFFGMKEPEGKCS